MKIKFSILNFESDKISILNFNTKMSNKTECIRVIIRCRPMSTKEIKD